jgi:hypothetical protein
MTLATITVGGIGATRAEALAELGQRLAHADLGKTRQAYYSEQSIGWRVAETLGALPELPSELERQRFTDAYRSRMHLLLLQRELEGQAPAVTDNDQWAQAIGPIEL